MPRTGSRHLTLDPAFIRAVRANSLTQRELCRVAGFPSDHELAAWMVGKPARTTPLVVGRLGSIAQAIRYTGGIFAEPDPTAEERAGR